MNDYKIFVIIPFCLSFIVYWSLAFLFYVMDKNFAKYRIDENINWSLYKKTVYYVLYLQFCYSLPVLYLLIPIWKWRNITILFNQIIILDIFKFFLNCLLGETIFYYLHYISHFLFYSKIHKVHHEWTNTCAVAAAYAHPLEYLLISLPSFLLPPIITGSNWIITNIWFLLATIMVIIEHSGYKYIKCSEFHWKHHKYFNINYGKKTLIDIIIWILKKINYLKKY